MLEIPLVVGIALGWLLASVSVYSELFFNPPDTS